MSCEFNYFISFHWVNTDNSHIRCSYKFNTMIYSNQFLINIDKNIKIFCITVFWSGSFVILCVKELINF